MSSAASSSRLATSTLAPAGKDTLHLDQAGILLAGRIGREHPSQLQHVEGCPTRFFGRLGGKLRPALRFEQAPRFAPSGDDLPFSNGDRFRCFHRDAPIGAAREIAVMAALPLPETQTTDLTARRISRGRLFRKYLLLILSLVTIALLASGAISIYFTYQ